MRGYSHFIAFCNEPIYADGGVYNIQKRKYVYFDLCEKGLEPLLDSKGYVLECDKHHLTTRCLKLMWLLSLGKYIRPLANRKEYHEEHENMFNFLLHEKIWEEFWNSWDGMQDFQSTHGQRFKDLLPLLLWTWIDLPKCTMTAEIEYFIKEEEDAMVSKRKDDPYLIDTSQIDYHDRHKF
jgi:hypothetical protein